VLPSVELQGLRKRFGAVSALETASLTAFPGEVHALVGENGAGKTTLMNILNGMVAPDAGTMRLGGHPFHPSTPRDAAAAGVGMVHQHFTLVPRLTVLENVALGVRRSRGGLRLHLPSVRERLRELMRETGLELDPERPVEGMGVGARQRVEILKLLHRDPAVLILDEPTSVLAPAEVTRLFAILRRLADGGRTVLLIAHKLDEVLAVADRITVLRDGATVLEALRAQVDGDTLARAMVGRPLPSPPPRSSPPANGLEVASLQGVAVAGGRGEEALRGVDLSVVHGEVVGIAGVEGNGQRELALVLAGRLAPARGRVRLPESVGFIPQDRREEGLVLDFTLTENVALAHHSDPAYLRRGLLRWRALEDATRVILSAYAVRAPGPGTGASALSGGNQQKVVVGRELSRSPDLLVVENPTRGLDIAAADFVHRELLRLQAGTEGSTPPGIVLLSNDLDEILALSQRILVMVRGRLIPVPEGERTREGVGALMLSGGRS